MWWKLTQKTPERLPVQSRTLNMHLLGKVPALDIEQILHAL